MAEYIDKSFVLYVIHHFGNMQTWSTKDIISECKRKIESEKAADVAPVVHGKWTSVFHGNNWKIKCSNCGRLFDRFADGARSPEYCFCGAKMDLKDL